MSVSKSRQKMLTHGLILFSLLASLLYVAQNCGKKPSSRLKTLDNFANGTRNLNACAGNPALASDPGLKVILGALEPRIQWSTKKDHAGLLDAINKSFTAVPPAFQTTFMSLGGQIIVSSDSNMICTGAERKSALKNTKISNSEYKTFSEGMDEVGSCYLFMPPSVYKKEKGRDGQLIAIVIPDNATEIQHSFVRMFGYLTAEMYSHLYFDKNSTSVVWSSVENAGFSRWKGTLADAFLSDIQGSSTVAARFKNYTAGGSSTPPEKRAFADSVYAEAFDSFFCKAYANDATNTRSRMAKQFPSTYSKFSGGAGAPSFGLADSQGPQGDDAGMNLTSSGQNDRVGAIMDALQKSVDRGKHARTFTNSRRPIIERMNVLNWYKSVKPDVVGNARGQSSSGFALGGAISEVWQGAGILYGEYYKRTEAATLKALNRSDGSYPGFLGSVSGVVQGVSDGTGYSDAYKDIQARTDVIYQTVQDGRGTDKPLGFIDTASVIANSTVDQIREIPGGIGPFKIGKLAGIAQDTVSSFEGAKFDDEGKLQELSASERIKSGGSAVIGLLGETGATEFLTEKAMGSGGMIKRLEDNPLINDEAQAAFGASGRALQRVNIANDQLREALDNSEIYGTITKLGTHLGGPGGFIPSPEKLVDMGAEKILDNAAESFESEEKQGDGE